MNMIWTPHIHDCPLLRSVAVQQWQLPAAPHRGTYQCTRVQGLRCFPLFLMRIITGTLLAVIYAASYANQGNTFGSIAERSFIFMLVAGILPLLTFTSLPVYSNAWKVRQPCRWLGHVAADWLKTSSWG